MTDAFDETTGDRTATDTDGPVLARVICQLFATFGLSLVWLDERCRIVGGCPASPLADGAVAARDGRLAALDPDADASLQALLEGAASAGGRDPRLGADLKRSVLRLDRAGRQSLIVRAIAVDAASRPLLEGAALMVILLDLEAGPSPSADLLRQVFGLTRGEARLASHLLRGDSLAEIAARTSVSVGTLRSQTKGLFAKTRTRRQGELIALLMRVVMIPEAALA